MREACVTRDGERRTTATVTTTRFAAVLCLSALLAACSASERVESLLPSRMSTAPHAVTSQHEAPGRNSEGSASAVTDSPATRRPSRASAPRAAALQPESSTKHAEEKAATPQAPAPAPSPSVHEE
jgi:hypothetical protein